MLFKAEVLDDITRPAGKTFNKVGQIRGDIVWVAFELLEREPARVVERHARHSAKYRLNVLDLPAG